MRLNKIKSHTKKIKMVGESKKNLLFKETVQE